MTVIEPRLFPMPQTTTTSDDYYTPRAVFDAMGLTFDIDVCAPPGGIEWIPAKRYFTQEDDGLLQPWEGRVWMNPPYSAPAPWIDRFIEHRSGVALVAFTKNAATDRLLSAADGICFPGHPFVFVTGHKPKGHMRTGEIFWPVWFAAFGEECVDAISRLGLVRVMR
jgi:hypothetical protein